LEADCKRHITRWSFRFLRGELRAQEASLPGHFHLPRQSQFRPDRTASRRDNQNTGLRLLSSPSQVPVEDHGSNCFAGGVTAEHLPPPPTARRNVTDTTAADRRDSALCPPVPASRVPSVHVRYLPVTPDSAAPDSSFSEDAADKSSAASTRRERRGVEAGKEVRIRKTLLPEAVAHRFQRVPRSPQNRRLILLRPLCFQPSPPQSSRGYRRMPEEAERQVYRAHLEYAARKDEVGVAEKVGASGSRGRVHLHAMPPSSAAAGLSLAVGDLIEVTDKSDPGAHCSLNFVGTAMTAFHNERKPRPLLHDAGWWLGKKIQTNESGWFPSNYVEHVVEDGDVPKPKGPPAPSSLVLARAEHDYEAQAPDELTLTKGAILSVLEKYDGWWKGDLNGSVGMFPANVSNKAIPSGERTVCRSVEPFPCAASNYPPVWIVADTPTCRLQFVTIIGPDDNTPEGGDRNRRIAEPKAFKLAAYGVKQGGIGSLFAGGVPMLKKKSSGTKETPSANPPTQEAPAVSKANPPLPANQPLPPPDCAPELPPSADGGYLRDNSRIWDRTAGLLIQIVVLV
ncbi:MAG: hypothetical protein BJ554DRAFT_3347, partial [Olpidium bornovanus]